MFFIKDFNLFSNSHHLLKNHLIPFIRKKSSSFSPLLSSIFLVSLITSHIISYIHTYICIHSLLLDVKFNLWKTHLHIGGHIYKTSLESRKPEMLHVVICHCVYLVSPGTKLPIVPSSVWFWVGVDLKTIAISFGSWRWSRSHCFMKVSQLHEWEPDAEILVDSSLSWLPPINSPTFFS